MYEQFTKPYKIKPTLVKLVQQNLNYIQEQALLLQNENDHFVSFLKEQDEDKIDAEVQKLNKLISPQISCTACGNCCKTLLVNIDDEEAKAASDFLNISVEAFKEKYVEVGSYGRQLINQIPCHFLNETVCSIYESRFSGCKEFPALHLPKFTHRLFTTFMHYDRCPIIFNVVEELKRKLKFIA